MENMNIDKIMVEIREQIKEKGMSEGIPSFEDIPVPESPYNTVLSKYLESDSDQEIARMESESNVPYFFPMPGGIKNTIKKVIRKTVHCAFFPVMEAQNRFNRDVAGYLKNQNTHNKAVDEQCRDILKRLELLEADNKKFGAAKDQ